MELLNQTNITQPDTLSNDSDNNMGENHFCLKPVVLTFTKVDAETGIGLEGAVFQIFCNGKVIAVSTSDKNGNVSFPNLYPGEYTLKEKTPPPGYEALFEIYPILIDKRGNITVCGRSFKCFRICNTKHCVKYGCFTVYKFSQTTKQPLANAIFQLFGHDGTLETSTTGKDGIAHFDKLLPGFYKLIETQAPSGYQPHKEKHTIQIKTDGNVVIDGKETSVIEIENIPNTYYITFTKIDSITEEPLKGAGFELSSCDTKVECAYSGSDGKITFNKLLPGTYILCEKTTVPGYLPNHQEYKIVITKNGDITIDGQPFDNIKIKNIPAPGFQVLKYGINQQPLKWVGFQLLKNNLPVASAVTDIHGYATFKALEPGSYHLIESVPPSGYIPYEKSHLIMVDDNGNLTIDGKQESVLTIQNIPYTFDLEFFKVNAQTCCPLTNAVFILFNDTVQIGPSISDRNGRVVFGSLLVGTYTLREIAPPPHYVSDGLDRTVVIRENGIITIDGIPMENYRFPNYRA